MHFPNRLHSFLQRTVEALETRLGRRLFWAAAVLAFLITGVNAVWRAEFPRRKFVQRLSYSSPMAIGTDDDRQAKYRTSEFRGFRRVAWGAVLEGIDPYTDLGHLRAYPPFFAVAFFPFTAVWALRGLGSSLFYSMGFAFALLSAHCCSKWWDGKSRFGVFAVIFIMISPLVLNVLSRSESDMFVLLPVAAAFTWTVRGKRGLLAGVLLGFAASFKVLPGLFGLYFLCRRRWRPLAGMAAGAVMCTIVLPVLLWGPGRAWELHLSWYRNVVAPYSSGGLRESVGPPTRASNQSLSAALFRYLRPIDAKTQWFSARVNVATLEAKTVLRLTQAIHVCLGLGLLGLWIFCPAGEEGSSRRAALMATVGPGILLLSHVSLTTHHVLLLLPLSAVLVRMLMMKDGKASGWGWVIAAYAAALIGIAIPFTKILTPLLPATLCLLAVCTALALRVRKDVA